MSEHAIALKVHRENLASLEAKPDPNWEDRGSIKYHQEAIRILERLESERSKSGI